VYEALGGASPKIDIVRISADSLGILMVPVLGRHNW
jgi:hypothetical protein